MIRKPTKHNARRLSGALIAVAVTIAAIMPASAEPAKDTGRIDLLRPGRLLVQLTDQDRTEVAAERYRLSYVYTIGSERGYRDVSRSNLLNSPAARYLARKLTGSNGR